MPVGVFRTSGEVGQNIRNRYPQQHGGDDGDPHRGHGVAHAPHDASQHLGNGHRQIARCHDPHHLARQNDEGFGFRKDGKQVLVQEQQHDGDDGGEAQRNGSALAHAFVNPVIFARAHILSGVNGHGLAEGEVRHHGKTIHPHNDDIGGNDHLPHRVGQGLDHHHGACHDGLGNAGGNADGNNSAGDPLVQPDGGLVQIEQVAHAHQLDEAEDGGNTLGNDGCQGHAGNAHAELGHKQQIQHHVQRRRQQQEAQSGHRVSQAPEHTGEHIIEEEAHDAVEEDIQVFHAPLQNGIRGIQQAQHGPGNHRAEDHNDKAGHNGQRDTVAHILGQALPVPGAEALGNDNACAGGDTHKQRQQQIQDRAGAAHGCQGIVAHVKAYNDGIRRIVKLLRHISQQHGDGEFQDALPGRSNGHVLCRKQTFQAQNRFLLFCFIGNIVSYLSAKCNRISKNRRFLQNNHIRTGQGAELTRLFWKW